MQRSVVADRMAHDLMPWQPLRRAPAAVQAALQLPARRPDDRNLDRPQLSKRRGGLTRRRRSTASGSAAGGGIMSAVTVESGSAETAAYGGLIDAIGGIAAAVLAIIGLSGFDPERMADIATIVVGAALLIQGGTILSEYVQIFQAAGTQASERVGGDGLAALFMVGAAGLVLGVLALLGMVSVGLTAIAVIAYGSALVLGSTTVRQLHLLQARMLQLPGARSGTELLAGQMAAGSAGIQLLTGLAATVLGILAIAGHDPVVLTLAALLVLGVTVLLTGSALSGLVLSFVRPSGRSPV
jgi:hypothetical protein